MPVRGGGRIDRSQQIELFDQRPRAEIEQARDRLRNVVVGDDTGPERRDVDTHGLCDTDGIGDLDLASGGDLGGDDVLRDVACKIGSAPVDLGWIFPAECAASVTAHAAVRVDDDLAPREPGITVGPTDDEAPGGIHMHLGAFVDHAGGNARHDHFIDDRFFELFVLHAFGVLR